MKKEKNYRIKIMSYIIIGLAVMAAVFGVAYIALLFMVPYVGIILPFIFLVIFSVLIVCMIIALLYTALFIGVGIRYLFKPMVVSNKDKGYSVAKTKESGKRQKGKTK